jgi:hypothetical protein
MKTLKTITSLFLFSLCLISFSQTAPAKAGEKSNVYLVQLKHTPEQCMTTLNDIKDKGEAFLSKFEWGCMSGEHNAYAFLEGKSEADVKSMLPKDVQATAKVLKVEKFTAGQIENLHKKM